MSGDDFGRLLYLGLLLAAVAGWGLAEYRGRLGQGARSFLAWGLIFIGVMAGYGLWQDIRRDVIPVQMENAEGIEVPRAEDGHYYLTLSIGSETVMFMVDTGASGVVLTQDDARRIGIVMEDLSYTGLSSTANGTVRTASVTLRDVTFGPYHDDSIGAWVNEGDLDVSLLGMDYLGRFAIDMRGDRMVLRR